MNQFAHCSIAPLPKETEERDEHLKELYQEILQRLKNHGISPTPKLKAMRALAAFFPRDFTTLFTDDSRNQVADAFGVGRETRPAVHRIILERLEKVLYLAGDDLESVAVRMCLPRLLHVKFVEKKNSDAPHPAEETGQAEPADVTRTPLADVQTAIRERGHFPAELVAQLDAGL